MHHQIVDIDNTRTKKLIVCCDGTWMDSDGGGNRIASNVTRLARAIRPADSAKHPQIVYYQAGIGTGLGLWNRIAGGGTGLGFSEHVREAYAFLANNYRQDDKVSDSIFLIGFSRGAYTARSLGGLVGQLGLLSKESMCWFYDIFNDWQNAGNPAYTPTFWRKWSQYTAELSGGKPHALDTPSNDLSRINEYLAEYRSGLLNFKLTQDATISAIGVFDTVGALGIPVNPIAQKLFRLPSFLHWYKWVDTSLDSHVKNAFHALALDEHRAPFYPSVWERPEGCTTNLKQVWFAGPHSNVGGAYLDTAQANITLAWMMDQLSGDDLKTSQPDVWRTEDWLEFDVRFLVEERRLNMLYQGKSLGTKRSWGMGSIYDSLTFPQSLAGSITRRPGRSHPSLYPSDCMDQTRLLRNTNERVHASVRCRIDKKGNAFEPDPQAGIPQKVITAVASLGLSLLRRILGRDAQPYYRPDRGGPLDGWELRDGQNSHDQYAFNTMDGPDGAKRFPPYWEYVGKDPLVPKNFLMPEDRLGYFEKVLLAEYTDCAEKIEATNLGSESAVAYQESLRDSATAKAKTF